MAATPAFRDVFPILVTPFDDQAQLDLGGDHRDYEGSNSLQIICHNRFGGYDRTSAHLGHHRSYVNDTRSLSSVTYAILPESQMFWVDGTTIKADLAPLVVRQEINHRCDLLASSRIRYPGTSIDAAATAQLQSLLATVLPDTNLAHPLEL